MIWHLPINNYHVLEWNSMRVVRSLTSFAIFRYSLPCWVLSVTFHVTFRLFSRLFMTAKPHYFSKQPPPMWVMLCFFHVHAECSTACIYSTYEILLERIVYNYCFRTHKFLFYIKETETAVLFIFHFLKYEWCRTWITRKAALSVVELKN